MHHERVENDFTRDRERNYATYTTVRQNQNQNQNHFNQQKQYSVSKDKEKELSQLREMIQKTYKIVGEKSSVKQHEAEKDYKSGKRPLAL